MKERKEIDYFKDWLNFVDKEALAMVLLYLHEHGAKAHIIQALNFFKILGLTIPVKGNKIIPSSESDVRKAVLWACLKTSKGNSRHAKAGCGEWNISMSKRTNGDRKNKWQSICVHCGKKKNLQKHSVMFFDNKELAKRHLQELNVDIFRWRD